MTADTAAEEAITPVDTMAMIIATASIDIKDDNVEFSKKTIIVSDYEMQTT